MFEESHYYAPCLVLLSDLKKNFLIIKLKLKEGIGLSTLLLHSLLQLRIHILDIGHHPPPCLTPPPYQSIQSTIVSGLINNRNVSDLKVENPKSRGPIRPGFGENPLPGSQRATSHCAHMGRKGRELWGLFL